MTKKQNGKKVTDVEEVDLTNLVNVDELQLSEGVPEVLDQIPDDSMNDLPDEVHFEEFIQKAEKKAKVEGKKDFAVDDLIGEDDAFVTFGGLGDDEDLTDLDEDEDEDEDEEDGETRPKKRERGLSRLPVDRSQDKRRMGK